MNVSLCIWFLLTLSLSAVECNAFRYSQPSDSIDGFIPVTQTDLKSNGKVRELSTETNQSHAESILMSQSNSNSDPIQLEESSTSNNTDAEDDVIVNEFFMEIRNLQEYIFNFFDNILSKDSDSFEIASGVRVEALDNSKDNSTSENNSRSLRNQPEADLFLQNIRNFGERYDLRVNMPRAMESGRLFFFSGMYSV